MKTVTCSRRPHADRSRRAGTALALVLAIRGATACGSDETIDLLGASSATTGAGGPTTTTGGTGGTTGGAAGAAGAAGAQGTGGSAGHTGSGGYDPATDPTAHINHPANGEMRTVNVPIPFVGVASDPQDGTLTGAALVWTSDLEGPFGTGETFDAPLTIVGTHLITLTATDSDGNSNTSSITLIVQP